MYALLSAKKFEELQRKYPDLALDDPAGDDQTAQFTHFIIKLRKALRDARTKLNQQLLDHTSQSRLTDKPEEILESLGSIALTVLRPKLRGMIKSKTHPILLNTTFLNDLLKAAGINPTSTAAKEIKTFQQENQRASKLDAMCTKLYELLCDQVEKIGLEEKKYEKTLKAFIIPNVKQADYHKMLNTINDHAHQPIETVKGSNERQAEITAKNQTIEQAQLLHTEWDKLTKFDASKINDAGDAAIVRDTDFSFDTLPELKETPLPEAEAARLRTAEQEFSTLHTMLTKRDSAKASLLLAKPTFLDLLTLQQEVTTFTSTHIDPSLKTSETNIATTLRNTLNLFVAVEIRGNELKGILKAAKQTGWPGIGIHLSDEHTTLSTASANEIKLAINTLLTKTHNAAGQWLYDNFFNPAKQKRVVLAPKLALLFCDETREKGDTAVIPEENMRDMCYSVIEVKKGGTLGNRIFYAKVLETLNSTEAKGETSQSLRLRRQHEAALWQTYGLALQGKADKDLRPNQALFPLDILLVQRKLRQTKTPFQGFGQRTVQLANMICSQTVLQHHYSHVIRAASSGQSENAIVADWIAKLRAACPIQSIFGAMKARPKTKAGVGELEIERDEIDLIEICWAINGALHDKSQKVTNKTTLTTQLDQLRTIILNNQNQQAGLNRLIAMRAAFEWFDVIYQLSYKSQTSIFDCQLENDLREIRKAPSGIFGTPSFTQPYLPIRAQMRELLEFMIERDAKAEDNDDYAWRRAELAEAFGGQYKEFLVAMLKKPGAKSKASSDLLTEKLVAYADLTRYCKHHAQPMPAGLVSPTISALGDKLISYTGTMTAEERDFGHVNKANSELESDEELQPYQHEFKTALETVLPQKPRLAFTTPAGLSMGSPR